MAILDFNAPIIAGGSAAGFELRMNADRLEPLLANATTLECLPTSISAQLATGRTFVFLNAWRKIGTVFFGQDVRLAFNSRGELFCIWVQHGYKGLYLSKFGLGTPMRDIAVAHPLIFDDGDEVNYVDGGLVPGISFCGNCASLAADPEQRVSAICVHDWSRK